MRSEQEVAAFKNALEIAQRHTIQSSDADSKLVAQIEVLEWVLTSFEVKEGKAEHDARNDAVNNSQDNAFSGNSAHACLPSREKSCLEAKEKKVEP